MKDKYKKINQETPSYIITKDFSLMRKNIFIFKSCHVKTEQARAPLQNRFNNNSQLIAENARENHQLAPIFTTRSLRNW